MPYYPEKKPDIPEETKQETKTTERRRKLLRLSLVVLSCLLVAYGGIRLGLYFSELAASRQTGRELRQLGELFVLGDNESFKTRSAERERLDFLERRGQLNGLESRAVEERVGAEVLEA